MKQKIKELFTAIDKQAHMGWGGTICAVMTLVCALQDVDGVLTWRFLGAVAVGTIVAVIAAAMKDFIVDSKCDAWDIAATVIGTLPIWAATALGILFDIISHA